MNERINQRKNQIKNNPRKMWKDVEITMPVN